MKSNETIENTGTTLLVSEAKRKREKEVTTVEYAVMLVLIAIAVMAANPGLSGAVVGVFTNMSTKLTG